MDRKVAREGELLAPPRLTRDAVAAWVRREQPDASEEAVARVYAASEGNPLFVQELLRVRTALDAERLPDGLRAVLDEHVARVSPEARALLGVAAVLGRTWDDAALAAIAGASADDVAAAAREAESVGLAAPLARGRHAFAHILLRDRLYAELPPSRRAELHTAAGDLLAATGDRAAAAHHLFEAGASGRAAAIARDAAKDALARLAFEDAARLASRGAEAVEPESSLACELAVLHAEALLRQGATEEGKAAALRAAERAERIGEARLLAHAALVHGAEITTAIVDPVQIAVLRRARAALGVADDPLLARVTARLAAALVPPRRYAQAREAWAIADEAIAMARRLGDERTLLYVLRFAASAKAYGVDSEVRYALLGEIVAIATKLDEPFVLLDVLGLWAVAMREAGRRDAMDAALDAWSKLVREVRRPQYQWRLPLAFAMHAALDGDRAAADAGAQEALRLIEEAGHWPGLWTWSMNRISMWVLYGEVTHAPGELEKLIGIFSRVPALGALRAVALVTAGRAEEARGEEVDTDIDPHELPRMAMTGLRAIALRDTALARAVVDTIVPRCANTVVFWGPHGAAMFGPTAWIAGELLGLAGRRDEARAMFEQALVVAQRLASPPLVARVRASLDALGLRAAAPSSPPPRAIEVEQDGDVWRVRSRGGGAVALKDGKGVRYLAELVRAPGREVHVLELVGVEGAGGDAGPVLDAKAKAAYQERLAALRDRAEDARARGDAAVAERAGAEIDALADQLAAALGLDGRDRASASHVERARINVQRRLKDVIRRVSEHDPALARYLDACVKTGTFCVFRPV